MEYVTLYIHIRKRVIQWLAPEHTPYQFPALLHTSCMARGKPQPVRSSAYHLGNKYVCVAHQREGEEASFH